jgi:FtsP/CotA-like multicopper oxidase with cupredoxin domain
LNRREFLTSTALAAMAVSLRSSGIPSGMSLPDSSTHGTTGFVPDVDLELSAKPTSNEILPGLMTGVWSYRGRLLQGRAGTLEESGSYLGPTIRLHRGDRVRIRFRNELPDSTIVHWHGLTVPALMDGHPRLVIASGKDYVYEFEVRNRAGQYWYHPHPDQRTGAQIYRGLAGLLFVHDEEEASLRLPSGENEIPLVIQDRAFQSNELVYISGRMDAMTGFLGDKILVNGKTDHELTLSTGVYRLRILNASNSRIYKLAWSNKIPFTIIGTDGGLLEKPLRKPYLTISPAERVDVLVDLSNEAAGSSLELRSGGFHAAQMMMGRGMMGGGMMGGMSRNTYGGLEQGSEFKILSVRVVKKEKSNFRIPNRLSQPGFRNLNGAESPDKARVFNLSFMAMQWLLNDSTFEMQSTKDNETWKAGTLQTFEFRNASTGMMRMMQMAHPMHVHGGQFQVLQRTPGTDTQGMAASLREGFTDEGWKDTVLVLPGETVRLLMQFPQFKGLFLYHCHNLEHEDMGMMRNYRLT